MAGLTPTPAQQLQAIAWLRGRLFLNNFRRKGGKGELIARILLYPLFALLAIFPIAGAGAGAFFIVSHHLFRFFPYLTWAIVFLWTTLTISTQAQAPSFDLASLIRFPLRFPTYLLIRLLFGLLDVPTVVSSLTLLAAAIGIGIARPTLFPTAALILLLLDITILFFFRMTFLWFERLFAQRKTREIVMGLFFVGMLAFQYVNLTVNGGVHKTSTPAERARHAQRVTFAMHAAHAAAPILRNLPPGLAATALLDVATQKPNQAAPPTLGVCAFALAFLALFARRLRGEFHGESFSETAARPTAPAPAAVPANALTLTPSPPSPPSLSPILTACMLKEIRYITRSGPLMIPLIAPVFMAFIIVTRSGFASHSGPWLLPSALAYVLLALTANMYNILGIEGVGVQLFFLAPVRFSDIILAKNLVGLALIAVEVAITTAIVLSTAPAPDLPSLVSIYLWLAFTLLLSLTLGNIRSIYSPRLMDLGKFRRSRQGQLNVLIGLLVLLLCAAVGAAVLYLAHHLHQPWLPIPIFIFLSIMAGIFYRSNLNQLDQIALDRREIITAELCKT
jgi:ABC-2 type transport system permease protein